MEKTSRFYCFCRFAMLISALFFVCPFFAQPATSDRTKQFSKLSAPEKRWVIAHPFIAKKAYQCTQRARFATDSVAKTGTLKDGNGGQLDAFRHAYWMALLAQKMPARKARKLGEAHEKGNYLGWKKGMLEDSLRADSMLCVMDLQNNATGIKLGEQYAGDTAQQTKSLEAVIIENIKSGKMVIVRKNSSGQPVDAEGKIIVAEAYKGKWYVPKVLVRSDVRY